MSLAPDTKTLIGAACSRGLEAPESRVSRTGPTRQANALETSTAAGGKRLHMVLEQRPTAQGKTRRDCKLE